MAEPQIYTDSKRIDTDFKMGNGSYIPGSLSV
jgi:hypothetical protein